MFVKKPVRWAHGECGRNSSMAKVDIVNEFANNRAADLSSVGLWDGSTKTELKMKESKENLCRSLVLVNMLVIMKKQFPAVKTYRHVETPNCRGNWHAKWYPTPRINPNIHALVIVCRTTSGQLIGKRETAKEDLLDTFERAIRSGVVVWSI